MESTWVVIDKNFIQQVDQNELNRIIPKEARLLLTARTAYEIHTSPEKGVRRRCLETLDITRDRVDIIEEGSNDGLLGYEIKEKKPSGEVLGNYIKPLPSDLDQLLQKIDSHQWEESFEKTPAEEFSKIVSEISGKIHSRNKGSLKDTDTVRGIYAELIEQSRGFPLAKNIDDRWIIFRRLQVDGWMVLDRAEVSDENRLHDRIDSRVVDVALLTKNLATNDRVVRNIFSFFCPEGKLYP